MLLCNSLRQVVSFVANSELLLEEKLCEILAAESSWFLCPVFVTRSCVGTVRAIEGIKSICLSAGVAAVPGRGGKYSPAPAITVQNVP